MGEFSFTERDGHVLTVTLNRPERMNALHSPAHFELDQVFNDFEADPDLWVCILTGAPVSMHTQRSGSASKSLNT